MQQQIIFKMKILFSSKDHTYTSGDQIFTSVSKLVSKFKNEFDSEYWSLYKALQRIYGNEEFKKLMSITNDINVIAAATDSNILLSIQNEIKQEWKHKNISSIDKGNMYHLAKEESSYKRGYELNPFNGKEYPVIGNISEKEEKYSIIDNLYDLEDGFYPELLIWNSDHSIAGQSDKVFIETIDNIRYVDLDDFKSNSKISKYGFKGQRMKAPISHLQDCNYSHYNLQLSAYGWLLEQFGYTVRDIAFHHYNKMYKLEYLKTEIESMIMFK